MTNPSFLPENIKLEKNVILEELKMVKDNPADDIFNYFYEVVFNSHPLSLPILGTKKSLKALDFEKICRYFSTNFSLEGIVLSAAGNINHKVLVEKVKEHINNSGDKAKKVPEKTVPARVIYQKKTRSYRGKTEASHICIGGPGCSRGNSERYPLSLFTNILGGSISSRLFQKVREEKGLSYTIFASNTQYTDSGIIVIYAATSAANVNRVLDLINAEISDIKKSGIKKEELVIAKENTKGNIVLGVEDISSRMFRLGKSLLMDSNVFTIDDILKKIDSIELKDVNTIVDKYFQQEKLSLIIIGKNGNWRLK
ncbi:MAG: insulinase family protein [Actinobacteria bacterium]|nr:insulinase family protein [Actinomycetota bacterium]